MIRRTWRAELKRAKRVVGIAGGKEQTHAILAALRGNWISVLIADRGKAERLLAFGMHPPKSTM
jgi:DNA-binding transcriptional regulator LsrR (DeoR family)